MLEQRVSKLEKDMGQISAVLERLEPKINEILLTGAKQADLHRTQVDVAELKGRMVALEEKLGGRITQVDGRIAQVEEKLNGRISQVEEKLGARISQVEERLSGRMASIEGRMSGLYARVSMLPTIWTQLGLVFTTWAIGSGLLIFLLTRLLAK